MSLIAYGAQDIYLTGRPQITYFKVVYRRHTNFACEPLQQTLNGVADFGKKVTATVNRSGDLAHSAYVQATLPEVAVTSGSFRWVDDVGHHLIDEVEVEIGGQRIDRHTGTWMQVWSQLSVPEGKEVGFRKMIGHYPLYDAAGNLDELSLQAYNSETKAQTVLYVPLQFWFCRNVGLALPLIALQYHEVKLNITFRASSKLVIDSSGASYDTLALSDASLWIDYVFLDTAERRRFAQVSHEYLVEQVQFTGETSVNSSSSTHTQNVDLNFNHPVKELVWVVQHNDLVDSGANQWSNYTDVLADSDEEARNPAGSRNPVMSAKLQLNAQDRINQRNGEYFNRVQCWQHHTRIPESPGVNVFSFALNPENHQPSGTCNFSRIDNATLVLNLGYNGSGVTGYNSNLTEVKCKVYIFAPNYNVLRVMSGMAGLAYSN